MQEFKAICLVVWRVEQNRKNIFEFYKNINSSVTQTEIIK